MRAAVQRHRSARALAHAARGMFAQEDARVIDSLPGIAVPTLVILGDQDEPFVAPSRYMAGKIPGARLAVIEGAGHAANLDRPEPFNRILRTFLDDLPEGP
jgi:pimeloyl-ACP methyl ester carboxylesterase